MEYEIYKGDDELTHWGIRGMKWGVRRYQNKDGSLTPRGKKHLQAETDKIKKEEQVLKNRRSVKAKLDKLEARKKAVEEGKKELDGEKKKFGLFNKKKTDVDANASKKKKIEDMTDEELSGAIRRAQLEQQYKSLTATPESKATVSKGDGFVKRFLKESVEPAVKEAGKNLIKDKLIQLGKDKLGLTEKQVKDTKSDLDKLKEEYQTLNYQKQIKNLKEEAAKVTTEAAKVRAAEEVTSSAAQQPVKTVVSKKENTSAGKDFVKKSGLESSEWQDFKKKYAWGVESYATDRVDD